MSNTNTGGPAFPCPPNETTKKQCEAAGITYYAPTGMTLRDYFAAHAPEPPEAWRGGDRKLSDVIAWPYWYADAMLKARDE